MYDHVLCPSGIDASTPVTSNRAQPRSAHTPPRRSPRSTSALVGRQSNSPDAGAALSVRRTIPRSQPRTSLRRVCGPTPSRGAGPLTGRVRGITNRQRPWCAWPASSPTTAERPSPSARSRQGTITSVVTGMLGWSVRMVSRTGPGPVSTFTYIGWVLVLAAGT